MSTSLRLFGFLQQHRWHRDLNDFTLGAVWMLAGALCLLAPSNSVATDGIASESSRTQASSAIEVIEGVTWTEYNIRVVTPDAEGENQPTLESLRPELLTLLRSLDQQMSNFLPDSEVSQFNASRSVEWFPVSPGTAHVVVESLKAAMASDGAFDPTLAPIIRAWHFEQTGDDTTIPTDAEIESLKSRVGYQHLDARLDPPAIRKALPELELNLSAIAKGYIVDQIADWLRQHHYRNFMVQYGGEVIATGTKPDGSPWNIAISRPLAHEFGNEAIVPLHDSAMATSGNYRNFFEVDGVRYSHTINPRTARPVTHTLASVTVFAPTCEQADAAATIISVLGPEAGLTWANKQHLAAWLLVPDGENFRPLASEEFQTRFGSNIEIVPHAPATPSSAENSNSPWTTILLAVGVFGVFGVALVGLAIGTILSGRRLKGSCGGLAGMKDDKGHSICMSCTTPPEQCNDLRRHLAKQSPPPTSSQTDPK